MERDPNSNQNMDVLYDTRATLDDGRMVELDITSNEDTGGFDVSIHPVMENNETAYDINIDSSHFDTFNEALTNCTLTASEWTASVDHEADYDRAMDQSAQNDSDMPTSFQDTVETKDGTPVVVRTERIDTEDGPKWETTAIRDGAYRMEDGSLSDHELVHYIVDYSDDPQSLQDSIVDDMKDYDGDFRTTDWHFEDTVRTADGVEVTVCTDFIPNDPNDPSVGYWETMGFADAVDANFKGDIDITLSRGSADADPEAMHKAGLEMIESHDLSDLAQKEGYDEKDIVKLDQHFSDHVTTADGEKVSVLTDYIPGDEYEPGYWEAIVCTGVPDEGGIPIDPTYQSDRYSDPEDLHRSVVEMCESHNLSDILKGDCEPVSNDEKDDEDDDKIEVSFSDILDLGKSIMEGIGNVISESINEFKEKFSGDADDDKEKTVDKDQNSDSEPVDDEAKMDQTDNDDYDDTENDYDDWDPGDSVD